MSFSAFDPAIIACASASVAAASTLLLLINDSPVYEQNKTTFTQKMTAKYQAWRNEEADLLAFTQDRNPVPANEINRSTAMELVDHKAPQISTLLRAVSKGNKTRGYFDKASYKKARTMYLAIKRMLEQREPLSTDFMPTPCAAHAASLQRDAAPVVGHTALGLPQASSSLSCIGTTR